MRSHMFVPAKTYPGVGPYVNGATPGERFLSVIFNNHPYLHTEGGRAATPGHLLHPAGIRAEREPKRVEVRIADRNVDSKESPYVYPWGIAGRPWNSAK